MMFERFRFQLLILSLQTTAKKVSEKEKSAPTLHYQGPILETIQTEPVQQESVVPWRE